MNRFWLLLIPFFCAAVYAESKPTRMLGEGVKSMVQLIPDKLRPEKGEDWTGLKVNEVSSFLKKTLDGASIAQSGEFSSADHNVKAKNVRLRVSVAEFKADGINVEKSRVEVDVPEDLLDRVLKLKAGDRIKINGTFHKVDVYGNKEKLRFNVVLSDGRILN